MSKSKPSKIVLLFELLYIINFSQCFLIVFIFYLVFKRELLLILWTSLYGF